MELFDENKCIICCKETVEECSALSSRGMGAMLKSCEVRGETVVLNYLSLGQEKFLVITVVENHSLIQDNTRKSK